MFLWGKAESGKPCLRRLERDEAGYRNRRRLQRRDCTVCDHVQTETIPMLEHEHIYGDWQSNDTQHWKECRCGEKTEVGNHTFGEWTITKEPTTTETGSRERTCSICKYTQEETIPVHTHMFTINMEI